MSVFPIRDAIILNARMLEGLKETDSAYPERIVTYYNAIPNKVQAYTLTNTDAWCAAFVSVIMHQSGLDGFPFACGVANMYQACKDRDLLIKGRKPMFGDVAFYGSHSHVGIVYSFVGGELITIEGNANDRVMMRNTTDFNQFKGFARPYKPSTREVAFECIKGVYGNDDRARLLQAEGYDPVSVQQDVNQIMHAVELACDYGIPIADPDLAYIAQNIRG